MTQPVVPTPPDANALVYKLAEAKKVLDRCIGVSTNAKKKWKQALVVYEIESAPELPAGAPAIPAPAELPDLNLLGKNFREAIQAEKAAQVAFNKVESELNTHLVKKGAR